MSDATGVDVGESVGDGVSVCDVDAKAAVWLAVDLRESDLVAVPVRVVVSEVAFV